MGLAEPSEPAASSASADDEGEPLGTFARGDGREELRVSLKSYEGHPYVALRVWERDRAGQFWPSKGKGLSIRIAEAAGVAEACGTSSRSSRGAGVESRNLGRLLNGTASEAEASVEAEGRTSAIGTTRRSSMSSRGRHRADENGPRRRINPVSAHSIVSSAPLSAETMRKHAHASLRIFQRKSTGRFRRDSRSVGATGRIGTGDSPFEASTAGSDEGDREARFPTASTTRPPSSTT